MDSQGPKGRKKNQNKQQCGRKRGPFQNPQCTPKDNLQNQKPNGNTQQKFQKSKTDHRKPSNLPYFHFTRLKNLSSANSDEVMATIAEKESEFQKLLMNEIKPDILVLTLRVLTNVCEANFTELITSVLSQACSDKFLDSLQTFLMKLYFESSNEKLKNTFYHENRNRFWISLNSFFKKIMELIPRTACDKLMPVLEKVVEVITNIETKQNYKIDEIVKESSINLLKDLKEEIEKIKEKNKKKVTIKQVEEDEPPDNFRSLDVIPQLHDLFNKNTYIRKCKIKDAYESIEQYLDIQYRLLREDFVMPLRNGIQEYLNGKNKFRNDDFRIYTNVKLKYLEMCQNTVGTKLYFGHLKHVIWQQSKRFMFGGLLLLSKDNFQTVLFATVVNRDVKDLITGHILIAPCYGSVITPEMYKQTFVLLESKIYFEPYFQVLTAMKNINATNFPMEKYVVKAETSVELPAYLKHKPVLKFKECLLPIDPNKVWPSAKQLKLDESQLNAFKNSITQEFSIIQGPPGTGKTFLALQIVEVLLKNEEHWRKYGPIVIVCLTNHALDQFLEGILEHTESIVRVGTRSKSEALQPYSLIERRKQLQCKGVPSLIYRTKTQIEEILTTIRKLRLFTKCLTTPNVIVPLNCLCADIPKKQFKSDQDLIYWLTGLNVDMSHSSIVYKDVENSPSEEYDEDDNMYTDADVIFNNIDIKRYYTFNPPPLLEIFNNQIGIILEEIENLKMNGFNFLPFANFQIAEREIQLEILLQKRQLLQQELALHPLLNKRPTPTNNPRWKMYWHQVKTSYEYINNKIFNLEAECRQRNLELEEARQVDNLKVMKMHKVVGLTTNCAARNQACLRALRAPIVLVEEAAEILESHVVCAMTKNCQHVILIGDHKQLRPKPSVHELGTKFNLNISLFERMVNIRGECTQLAYQHRMRPQIAKLITPSIYEELHNHSIVYDHPGVKGLDKNLFFLNHNERERPYNNEDSWKNDHEVQFFIMFAKHLLNQGYKPNDITILCTYTGQLFTFMREINRHELLKEVRVTTVDNFQGEENKIILLSLVRNNGAGNIGFLKQENRVCVALSRAREGLYIMGNTNDLQEKNNIWPKIFDVLKEENAIGDALTLRCQIHTDQFCEVEKAEDFKKCPEGGCRKECALLLPCGHNCTSVCHILDREHKEYDCKQKCLKSCPKDHPCPLKCGQACEPCRVKIERQLKCGHIVPVPCSIEPNEFMCPVMVDVTLQDCKHDMKKPCHQPLEECQCTHACEIRLPCGHACPGKCHVRSDPEHLQHTCHRPCAKTNLDCLNNHPCKKRCFEKCEQCSVAISKKRSCGHFYRSIKCFINVEELQCQRPCKRQMNCGHQCKLKCSEECNNCRAIVEKRSTCGHVVKVKCCEEATPSKCNGKCPKQLPCGHPCTEKCKSACTAACKFMVKLKEPGLCGHEFSVPCYLRNTEPNSKELLKYCKNPCGASLVCEHTCKGKCGDCLQGRMHVPCSEPCRTVFICEHKCQVACNKECQPCKRRCELKCRHSQCGKQCGMPCVTCKESCGYGCKHKRCSKRCFELCDIQPCNEPCTKTLKCGHPCVGFCGEPCPHLCRICDKKELTELLFGDEDNENARFVLLPDCRHCIESKGLLEWIAPNNVTEEHHNGEIDKAIKIKCCPKCKTPIQTCMRLMNQIKMDLKDIMLIKKEIFGKKKQNLKKNVTEYLITTRKMKSDIQGYPELSKMFENLEMQVLSKGAKGEYIKTNLSFYEVSAFKNILNILIEISSLLKLINNIRSTEFYDCIKKQYTMLLNSIPRELRIGRQRIEDIQLELRRFQFMIKVYITFSSNISCVGVKEYNTLLNKLSDIQRFSENVETDIISSINKLKEENDQFLIIRKVIEAEVGFKKGHWFKCPQGHFYVIGECGGAMQIGKCIECKADVGGQQHRLLRGNNLAPEIDGATAPAWPL